MADPPCLCRARLGEVALHMDSRARQKIGRDARCRGNGDSRANGFALMRNEFAKIGRKDCPKSFLIRCEPKGSHAAEEGRCMAMASWNQKSGRA